MACQSHMCTSLYVDYEIIFIVESIAAPELLCHFVATPAIADWTSFISLKHQLRRQQRRLQRRRRRRQRRRQRSRWAVKDLPSTTTATILILNRFHRLHKPLRLRQTRAPTVSTLAHHPRRHRSRSLWHPTHSACISLLLVRPGSLA
ncbi:hypothetical protein PLICRDRAFT_486623 [Plicaturopsis crispa FD-325 SS-3]|nr:hypothetical protein PLICRDRAFT_486623 [Plicaturopsis crispa FD-325 SS-3]